MSLHRSFVGAQQHLWIGILVATWGAVAHAQPPDALRSPQQVVQGSRTADLLQPLNPAQPLMALPVDPAAVEIDLNQPITLEQALQLAWRNNLELRITELQLQQSQAALIQAKAANWPTLTAQLEIAREDSSVFLLAPQPFIPDAAAQAEVTQRTLLAQQLQEAQTLQDLGQDINDLQVRLTQGPDQQLQLTFDQQVQLLQQRATATATLPGVSDVAPIAPITPFASSGQGIAGGGITNSFTGTLALTYNLFTFGGRPSAIRAAKVQVKISELAMQIQAEDLRLDVTNDYYNLQEAGALVVVAQSAVTNAEQSLGDAEALEQAGIGTRAEILQAKVSLANAQQNLMQAQALYGTAQRQLSQRLNVPPNVNVRASELVQPAGEWPLSLPETIVLTLQNRPELSQLKLQRRFAQIQRQQILATARPQVQAFANIEVQDQLEDDVLGAFGYSLGFMVTWNIPDGDSVQIQARQQVRTVSILETQFADTKNALRFLVEQAYFSLEANRKNIDTSAEAVDQAQESLRLARLQFQAGLGTLQGITTAESDVTQAEGNLVSAVLDYNRALAAIHRATSYRQDPIP